MRWKRPSRTCTPRTRVNDGAGAAVSNNPCPVCGSQIAAASINISEGVALCGACGQLSRLAEVAAHKRPTQELLEDPPPGCRVTEWGHRTTLTATLRSAGGMLGALAAALFWNGITSVFVAAAARGWYEHLVGPAPDWFPAPPMDDLNSLGALLFMTLFLTPFVLVGVGMVVAVLLCAVGRVEVQLGGHRGVVRSGVGPVTWNQRFDPERVREVSIGWTRWQQNDQSQELIVIHADRRVKFGSMLTEERRDWLRAALLDRLVLAVQGGRR